MDPYEIHQGPPGVPEWHFDNQWWTPLKSTKDPWGSPSHILITSDMANEWNSIKKANEWNAGGTDNIKLPQYVYGGVIDKGC